MGKPAKSLMEIKQEYSKNEIYKLKRPGFGVLSD